MYTKLIHDYLSSEVEFTNKPAHDKTYNKTCVTSKDSDQPVHSPSMQVFSFILLWIARRL